MATSSPHDPLSSANVGALLNRAGDGVELQASTWVMALTAAELQPWRPSAGQGFSPSASRGESSAVQVGVQSSVALAALNMTRRSLRDTARVLGVTRSFLPGLELAELFYAEVVAPIVEKALAGVPYSAALIGWGSEVQGFDTQRSTDHAWGPRMQLSWAATSSSPAPTNWTPCSIMSCPPNSAVTRSASPSRRTHRRGTGYTSRTCGTSLPSTLVPTQPVASRLPFG